LMKSWMLINYGLGIAPVYNKAFLVIFDPLQDSIKLTANSCGRYNVGIGILANGLMIATPPVGFILFQSSGVGRTVKSGVEWPARSFFRSELASWPEWVAKKRCAGLDR
jgi:hypothetical protein